MPRTYRKTKIEGVNPDYVRMYYENQYDRVAKLENLRLLITNVVVTLSVVSFTFSFSGAQPQNLITGVILPSILIVSNLFAIVYIIITYQTIMTHLKRANSIISQYAPHLGEISKLIPTPMWTNKLTLAHTQLLFHILLIMLSILPVWMYFSK